MVFVGKRSYGIYLVHGAVLLAWTTILRRAAGLAFDALNRPTGDSRLLVTLMLFALGTVTSLIVADLLHRLVERRFIALGRRWSNRRSDTPEPAVALVRPHESPAKVAARRRQLDGVWAVPGSNQRPPACKFGSVESERRQEWSEPHGSACGHKRRVLRRSVRVRVF